MSGIPPIATELRTSTFGSFVPIPVIQEQLHEDDFTVGQFMEASDHEDSKQPIENDGAPDFTEIHDCLPPRPFRLP